MKIENSRAERPDRILLYGTEGIGKSTWAAGAPDPVFLDLEDGLAHLEVPCIKCADAKSIFEAFRDLHAEKHSFRTVIIDTVDAMESMIWAALCRKNNWDSIETPGYGKGYVQATEAWRPFLVQLDALRAKGLEVILVAHAGIKNFANPAGPDYSRYEPKLHKSAAALLKEWSDCILFANHDESARIRQGEQKAKAVGSGERILHTAHQPAWDAKNRCGLPETLPLDYAVFAEHRQAFRTVAKPTSEKQAAPSRLHPAPRKRSMGSSTQATVAQLPPGAADPVLSVDALRALASAQAKAVGAAKVKAAIKSITGGMLAEAMPEQYESLRVALNGLA